MARGTIIGMVWGAVVSVIGAGALSVAIGPPERPAPLRVEAPDAGVENASIVAQADPAPAQVAEAPETGEPEPVEAKPSASEPEEAAPTQEPGRRPPPEQAVDRPGQAEALAAPGTQDSPGTDSAPPTAPQVGGADSLSGPLPDISGTGTGVAVATDAPVLPSTQADAPGLPEPDATEDPSIAPDQPPEPPVPTVETALVPDPVADPDEGAAEDGVQGETNQEETERRDAEQGSAEAPGAEPEPEPAEPEPAETAESEAETDRPDTPDMDTALPAESGDEGGARIGTPAVSFADRAGAVSTRLPRIGAEEDAPADDTADSAGDSPLVRYAADGGAAVPDDLPRLAVILIDDGSGPLGPDALQAFPFPVSFAISPSHPRAAEVARKYRDLGFEVMALADLPEGASATDVEVSLAGALQDVPEAVAVLEGVGGGLQSGRDVSTQAAAFLAASGHGLVMQPRGLNTAQALVAREGVPAATLFRDFDGEGQDAGTIRRTLDNAAFRARQEGAVVMLGRLRADTVSALVLWGLQDRSGTLALVPVSTVLREAGE